MFSPEASPHDPKNKSQFDLHWASLANTRSSALKKYTIPGSVSIQRYKEFAIDISPLLAV